MLTFLVGSAVGAVAMYFISNPAKAEAALDKLRTEYRALQDELAKVKAKL